MTPQPTTPRSVINALGQPVGLPLPDWTPPPRPERVDQVHRLVRLEPMDVARHSGPLFEAYAEDRTNAGWTYLSHGPFDTHAQFADWMERTCLGDDPLCFAVIDPATNAAVGLFAYMRIQPTDGSIEIGRVHFSPRLQRRPAATAALFLLIDHAFSLGYRRCEWKCDALNEPSRAAALRLGFTYEGLFRQATVYRGRNRDTMWFSLIDADWPRSRRAYLQWLDPANFDEQGRQRQSLRDLIAAV